MVVACGVWACRVLVVDMNPSHSPTTRFSNLTPYKLPCFFTSRTDLKLFGFGFQGKPYLKRRLKLVVAAELSKPFSLSFGLDYQVFLSFNLTFSNFPFNIYVLFFPYSFGRLVMCWLNWFDWGLFSVGRLVFWRCVLFDDFEGTKWVWSGCLLCWFYTEESGLIFIVVGFFIIFFKELQLIYVLFHR